MSNNFKWLVILVAFADNDIEPTVVKERIDAEEDERLAAFLRGGELMSVIMLDDERVAEAERQHVEKMCLR